MSDPIHKNSLENANKPIPLRKFENIVRTLFVTAVVRQNAVTSSYIVKGGCMREQLPSTWDPFIFTSHVKADAARSPLLITYETLLSLRNGYNFDLCIDRIMYARNQQKPFRPPLTGGEPISLETATALRTIVFGSCATPPRGEWLRTGFVFREAEKDLAYGLRAPRNGTRGLLSALQAYVLKYLLFERKNENKLPVDELMKPDRATQTDALWRAISDILWKIGDKKKVVVALPQNTSYVPHSISYFQDSITEKLHLFEIVEEEELQIFLKRYIYIFQDEQGPASLLLLYSAVLTREIKKVKCDLVDEKQYLVTMSEEGSHCTVMLLLTGRASPFLHNGVMYVGDEDHYAKAHFGVLTRSEIGFLFFEDEMGERAPGSRLKTPSLPIWVVYCLGHFGVVFNTNRELLRNYHAERRFELFYYTCSGSQCQLTVDTRGNPMTSNRTEDNLPTLMAHLEKLIHTKWEGAHIGWNGATTVI